MRDSGTLNFVYAPGFGAPGTAVSFVGNGCTGSGATVTVGFYDAAAFKGARYVRTYTPKPDGTFRGSITVPSLPPKLYHFAARCQGATSQSVDQTFLVQAGASAAPTTRPSPTPSRPRPTTAAPTHAPSPTPSQTETLPAAVVTSAPPAAATSASATSSRTPLLLVAVLLVAGAAAFWSRRVMAGHTGRGVASAHDDHAAHP